jgi:hypothetical protein
VPLGWTPYHPPERNLTGEALSAARSAVSGQRHGSRGVRYRFQLRPRCHRASSTELPEGEVTSLSGRVCAAWFFIGAEQWSGEIHVPQTIEGAFAGGAKEVIVVLPASNHVLPFFSEHLRFQSSCL